MGYDLHITRAKAWFESRLSNQEIPLPEWRAYVRGDAEMRFDSDREDLAVWTAYSRHDLSSNMAGFLWLGGAITVKYPDNEIVGKMLRIAAALKAKVQGDDLEVYFQDGDSIYSTDGFSKQKFEWRR